MPYYNPYESKDRNVTPKRSRQTELPKPVDFRDISTPQVANRSPSSTSSSNIQQPQHQSELKMHQAHLFDTQTSVANEKFRSLQRYYDNLSPPPSNEFNSRVETPLPPVVSPGSSPPPSSNYIELRTRNVETPLPPFVSPGSSPTSVLPKRLSSSPQYDNVDSTQNSSSISNKNNQATQNNNDLPPLPTPTSTNRKTNIQVCIRLRPILPSDFKPKRPFPSSANTTTVKVKPSMNGLKPPRTPSVATDSSSDTMGPVWSVQNDNKTVASMNQYSSPTNNTSSNSFTFDHAYGPQHSTLDIYNNSVRDSVIATMDGYHSSVFAYGQTATGKTFTMSGNKSSQLNHHSKQYDQSVYDSNSIGIIQHSINDCFRYIQQQKHDIREYILRVSFMEIYNEVIYDLLAPPPPVKPIMNMSTSLSSSTNTKFNNSHETGLPLHSDIRIFESKQEGIVIRGLKEEIVTSPEQIFALIALGESRRQTGQTSANKQSSRSHSVFRLIVESRKRNISSTSRNNNSSSNSTPRRKNLQSQMSDDNFSTSGSESISSSVFSPGTSSGPVRVSTLSLVDLAGSESVRNTGSTGMRQKEGQYINKSLLTLGHVVRKLADLTNREDMNLDTSHIPYRDSKLTRILQPSLSGNAQIAIICNISPLQKHFDETVNTLKFASRAKRIKQNATITEVMDENTLLQDYRQEIDELKQQLKEAKEMHESIISKQKQEVEQEAEQQQYPVIGDRTEEENDEDIQVIVQAISNLERLILKTSTDEEAKKIKRRKERMKKNKRIIEGMEALEGGKVGGDIAKVTGEKPGGSTGGDSDTLLNMMNNEQGIDDDLIDDATLLTKKTVKSVDETSVATGGENGDLISELHRIQGLLGTVLVRRNTPMNPTSPTRSPRSNVLKTSDRDEEVQRLKAQLHETERSSSLRKADSSFLQQQLNAKDELLKEVSKLLESVEQRQMALEQDNAEVRNEWARAIASLRAKETEFENVTSLLKAKEVEITELRRKLGEQ